MLKYKHLVFIDLCKENISKTGYLSLGEFFENVSDVELKVIIELLYESTNSIDENTKSNAQIAVNYLLSLVQLGAALENASLQQKNLHLINFTSHAVQEVHDRKYICDKLLREKRLKYSIETEPIETPNEQTIL